MVYYIHFFPSISLLKSSLTLIYVSFTTVQTLTGPLCQSLPHSLVPCLVWWCISWWWDGMWKEKKETKGKQWKGNRRTDSNSLLFLRRRQLKSGVKWSHFFSLASKNKFSFHENIVAKFCIFAHFGLARSTLNHNFGHLLDGCSLVIMIRLKLISHIFVSTISLYPNN